MTEKRKFGETLKSKNPVVQVKELPAKIFAYNLTAWSKRKWDTTRIPAQSLANTHVMCKASRTDIALFINLKYMKI